MNGVIEGSENGRKHSAIKLNIFLNSARSYSLLRGHMTSCNKTGSRQKFSRRKHLKSVTSMGKREC